ADTFGFYSRWPFFSNRHLYSEDNLNNFAGSVPHHVRIYPYKKNGIPVANSYLVAFEETTTSLDYQDILFIVNNVKPAPVSSIVTVTPIADAYVRDGASGNTNFGSDTSLVIKGSAAVGFTRQAYLKF